MSGEAEIPSPRPNEGPAAEARTPSEAARTRRIAWTIAGLALIPLALLGVSWWLAPHLFDLRVVQGPTIRDDRMGGEPEMLYRRGRTSIYFTTDDLLYPNRWGAARPAYQAVVFDVVPGTEPWFREAHRLTWIVVCARALATAGTQGERASPPAGDAGERSSRRFLTTMGLELGRLGRGDHLIFEIPDDAPYRGQTGIRWFGALAVTLPHVPVEDRVLANLPQELDRSLRETVAALTARGALGIGLPLIDAADRLAGDFSDESSWLRILDAADDIAAGGSVDTLVLGAFGLTERTRNSKRSAFLAAWDRRRDALMAAAGRPTHEVPRLAALAMLAALVRLARSGRRLTLRRAAAYGLGAFAASASVVALSASLANFFGIGRQELLSLECALAVAAGFFLQTFLTFDPRKEMAA